MKIIKLGLILGLLSHQLQAVGTAFEDEGYKQNVTSTRPLEKLEVPSLTPIVLLGTLGSILSLSFVSNIPVVHMLYKSGWDWEKVFNNSSIVQQAFNSSGDFKTGTTIWLPIYGLVSLVSFYYMAKKIKVRNEIIKLNQRIDAQNAALAIG